jgi:hypothetical protein
MHEGQTVVATTTSENDIDLYFTFGDCPTYGSYDQVGFGATGNEELEFTAPEDGFLYIGVRGYSDAEYTLTMTCDGEPKMCYELWDTH